MMFLENCLMSSVKQDREMAQWLKRLPLQSRGPESGSLVPTHIPWRYDRWPVISALEDGIKGHPEAAVCQD